MKREYVTRTVPVQLCGKLPKGLADLGYGCTHYKGVTVVWDEDYDCRILDFIDLLSLRDLRHLIAAQECQACLTLIWKGTIPNKYITDKQVEVAGDCWTCFSELCK